MAEEGKEKISKQKNESGQPGGGQERRDEVGRSGVYPMSGPETRSYVSQEIPRGEWLSFLDSFSRQHEGWLVTMEVRGGEAGSGVEGENLKLEGVTPEHSEGHDRISIALGKDPDDHLTHFVADPKRVLFLETQGGDHLGLQVEAADGSRTILRFRGPAKRERLNDVAA